MGGDRAGACLEAIGRTHPPPGLVILIDSCLSRLIGEDVEGAVAEFQRTSAIPTVLYDVKLVQEPYLMQPAAFWCKVFHALAEPERRMEPRRVCLLASMRRRVASSKPRSVPSAST